MISCLLSNTSGHLTGKHEQRQFICFFFFANSQDRIRTVHEAVVSGNIAQVRQVLTRKRFALSRDHLGASPLHLAVLHGHTDVLNYIVERFPETLDGPDNMGHTPEYYLKNPKELSIRDLLANYHTPSEDDKSAKADVWQRPSTPPAAEDGHEASTALPEEPTAPVAPAVNGGATQHTVVPNGKAQQREAAPVLATSETSKTTNSVPPVVDASRVAPAPPPAPQRMNFPSVPSDGVRQPVEEPLQTAIRLPLGEQATSRAPAATGQPVAMLPSGKYGQNGGTDMVQLAQSLLLTGRTPEEAQYLRSSVGDALVGALAAVDKQRPPDPVTFVASWLKQSQTAQKPSSARASNTTMPVSTMQRTAPVTLKM
ncbi:hypothetical protein HPB51_026273 [Rhipicephalus microplus]|uniref:Uncharacterized protein n=1 Tax=Rhipicephalus microplus TaxID=6941 RepID=A0A9J6D7X4_RHIMP|nr:hypothetical protein HPB51_026273 [Rhipicephalus microplus]